MYDNGLIERMNLRQVYKYIHYFTTQLLYPNDCFLILQYYKKSTKSFMEQLLDLDFPYTKDHNLGQLSKNERYLCMWTEIIDPSNFEYFKSIGINSIEFVNTKLGQYVEIVGLLAEVIDYEERIALSIASSECKKAFYQCMYFLGKYEFLTPLNKTSTVLIVLATDHKLVENVFIPKFNEFKNEEGVMTKDLFEDCFKTWDLEMEALTYKRTSSICTQNQVQYDFNDCVHNRSNQILEKEFVSYCSKIFVATRRVILKFMTNEDQYRKEINDRRVKNLDSKFVKDIMHQPENNSYEDFITASIQSSNYEHLKGTEYKFMLVLPSSTAVISELDVKSDSFIRENVIEKVSRCLQYIFCIYHTR